MQRHAKRPFLDHDEPLFFAHRGGSLLAPENTLAAYACGLSYGADAIELDLHVSRDGELVVMHDDVVDRVTDGTGPVSGKTLAELQALDAGYHFTTDGGATYPFRGKGVTIPTFREVLERFPQARINIDQKENNPLGDRLLWDLAQEFHAEDRIMVGSFHQQALDRFRRLTGGRIATSASPPETRGFVLACLLRTSHRLRPVYDALQVPETYRGVRVVSPTSIARAHDLGLEVHVWTVDDRETMDRLLAWGVDGLMSDRPDILAEALGRQRLPTSLPRPSDTEDPDGA